MSAATHAWVKGGREVPRDSIVSSGGVFDMSEAGRRSDAEDDDVEGGGKRVGSILRCSKSQLSGEGSDTRKAIDVVHYLFQSCCCCSSSSRRRRRRRRCFDGGCKNKNKNNRGGRGGTQWRERSDLELKLASKIQFLSPPLRKNQLNESIKGCVADLILQPCSGYHLQARARSLLQFSCFGRTAVALCELTLS